MNERLQAKIDEYIKAAKANGAPPAPSTQKDTRPDSLSEVIRSKKDADIFMAELNSAFNRARK